MEAPLVSVLLCFVVICKAEGDRDLSYAGFLLGYGQQLGPGQAEPEAGNSIPIPHVLCRHPLLSPTVHVSVELKWSGDLSPRDPELMWVSHPVA